MSTHRVDFFISYNSKDKAWAEWIASKLEDEGHYTTVIQEWDFVAGSNFVLEMQKAAAYSDRTIIVLSQHYLDAEYTQPEWAAAFVQDPTSNKRMLIPIRVGGCNPTGLLTAIRYIDLVGLDEMTATQVLLTQVKTGRLKPLVPPTFPGPSTNQLNPSLGIETHSVETWRRERVKLIAQNKCLTPLIKGASVILHLCPLVPCEPELSIEMLKRHGRELLPLFTGAVSHEFNHYGHMNIDQWANKEDLPNAYTQLFRSGQVEAVDKALLMPRKDFDGSLFIASIALERDIISRTRMYLQSLKGAGVELPIVVSLSFAQIHGYRLAVGGISALSKSTEENILLLPSIVIHEWNSPDLPELLKPVFDRLWNVFGYEGSHSYRNGVWNPSN